MSERQGTRTNITDPTMAPTDRISRARRVMLWTQLTLTEAAMADLGDGMSREAREGFVSLLQYIDHDLQLAEEDLLQRLPGVRADG